jgi:DNA-directed RNA polymerase specialized sigma24 family protein
VVVPVKERFEDLFGRLSPKMRSIAHRMNGHRTFFSDDDLYQESAVNMWSLYGAGELDGKTDSYILQGCYFHLKNYLRTHLDKARPVSIDAPIDESGMTLKDSVKYLADFRE